MSLQARAANVIPLKQALTVAEANGYAIGSFSPRCVPIIRPVLRAGQCLQSPLIVQISQNELIRYKVSAEAFAEEFYRVIDDERITVPVVLHLDHTKEFKVIEAAIAAGFSSVMIDASEKPLDENIETTRQVVEYAHARGVSVEAELGKIGTTDFVETDKDEELYTDPAEAKQFVDQTGVDALAVSVGTAHGVYLVRQPKVDYARLRAIRELTAVHLVLHGGSGVPIEMMKGAIQLPGGGVSKVNIATDLEVAFLGAIGKPERLSNAECSALPTDVLDVGRQAVEATVREKITDYLGSAGKASDFAE